MRSLRCALILAGGLMLHGCAGQPAKDTYVQAEIIKSIMRKSGDGELVCAAGSVRFCKGSRLMKDCSCVQAESVPQMVNSGY